MYYVICCLRNKEITIIGVSQLEQDAINELERYVKQKIIECNNLNKDDTSLIKKYEIQDNNYMYNTGLYYKKSSDGKHYKMFHNIANIIPNRFWGTTTNIMTEEYEFNIRIGNGLEKSSSAIIKHSDETLQELNELLAKRKERLNKTDPDFSNQIWTQIKNRRTRIDINSKSNSDSESYSNL